MAHNEKYAVKLSVYWITKGDNMKIYLSAFNGKLQSKPMDVPDNTTPDFYLSLSVDVLAYVVEKDVFDTLRTVGKRGHFRRTNYSVYLADLGYDVPVDGDRFCYEYKLVDVF